ncbi:MAG: alpha-hydroxy-acid oxidizing protein [Alphaproteobacteria bacterium]|nr:alpha-hydroxy-acid oxidizing protein [Alphaproteobacteria bacterium]
MDEITGRLDVDASFKPRLSDIDHEFKIAPLAWHLGNLKAAAKRRLPRGIFDFIEGGSYDENTMRANVADLGALRLRQRVLVTTPNRNQHTRILGQRSSMPVAIAPIGLMGVIYPRGEIHAARAAQEIGVPFSLSTLSTCTIEEVSAAVREPFFFQLYMFKDRAVNAALLQRAEQARCSALIVTVDTAVHPRRNRDLDNGMTVPLKIRPRNVARILAKPRWLISWLRHRPTLANLTPFVPGGADLGTVSVWAERNYKGAVGIADLEWIRANWSRKLVVKGVLDPEDAKLAIKLGADAVVVSNHGGRQLDGANSTVKAFPAIRDVVGDSAELLIDSGVRSGLDVLKILGLGAKACLLGRPFVYGLAAHGQTGVMAALRLIAQDLDQGMALTGVDDVNSLPSGRVIDPARA